MTAHARIPGLDGQAAGAPYVVLGLTGYIGAGKTLVKDAVIEALAADGVECRTYSFSRYIRDELERRGLEASRDTMTRVGNDMRRIGGAGVLARRILDALRPTLADLSRPTLIVAEALRNPGEVELFREELGERFLLVAVVAEEEVLAQRLVARGRDLDVQSGESPLVHARRWVRIERGEGEPEHGQQIAACVRLADREIDNSGRREELRARVGELVALLRRRLGLTRA